MYTIQQGLLGDYRFIGKSGVLDFIRQVGCIQFTPIDVWKECRDCFAIQNQWLYKTNAI